MRKQRFGDQRTNDGQSSLTETHTASFMREERLTQQTLNEYTEQDFKSHLVQLYTEKMKSVGVILYKVKCKWSAHILHCYLIGVCVIVNFRNGVLNIFKILL